MMKAVRLSPVLFAIVLIFASLNVRASEPAAAEPAPATAAAPAAEPAPAPSADQATAVAAPEVKKPVVPAPGSLQLKVGENTSFRFGLLFQPQADFSQNAAGNTGENLLLRRTRLMLGGQVTKSVFFFYQLENARLGAANASGTKTMNSGFQTLDAVAEWRLHKKFNLAGGLVRVPTSRDALESAASEFTIDFNTYAFSMTGLLGGMAGRDTGIMARGYFFNDRLEYRGAVVSGLRQAGSVNAFRTVGRLQYNFFDKEVYNLPSYTGANFGAKKILAVGAAYDAQDAYHGFTADAFADIPVRFGSVLGTVTYQDLHGGTFLTTLPKNEIITVDGGLYLKQFKVGPWFRYEQREFSSVANRDEERALVGINYYPMGNNFNIKAAYGRFTPGVGRDQNQFVLQLQAYYY